MGFCSSAMCAQAEQRERTVKRRASESFEKRESRLQQAAKAINHSCLGTVKIRQFIPPSYKSSDLGDALWVFYPLCIYIYNIYTRCIYIYLHIDTYVYAFYSSYILQPIEDWPSYLRKWSLDPKQPNYLGLGSISSTVCSTAIWVRFLG